MDYTYEKAKKIAAGLVAARMYTCREVEDRLKRRKIDAETAEKVVEEFALAGILDDFKYAKAYVSEGVKLSGKGLYRLKQELFAKGIARSIIDDVCENCQEDTMSALREYVESRRLNEGVTSRKELEKLKARLLRRGFSPSEVRECLACYDFKFYEEY